MARLAEALANKLGVGGAAASELTPAEQDWIERAAEACETAKQRALVTSGPFGDDGHGGLGCSRSTIRLKSAGHR